MDYKLFSASVIFVILGVVIMRKNKFYVYESDDMLFATKLKIFLSRLLLSLVGLYGIISYILDAL